MIPLIAGLTSLIAAVDIRSFRIPSSLVSILTVSGLLLHGLSHVASVCLLLIFALTAHYLPNEPKIGKGDIKFMAAAGLFIPLHLLDVFLILTGVSGILFGIYLYRNVNIRYFPFAPSITFALITVILLAE